MFFGFISVNAEINEFIVKPNEVSLENVKPASKEKLNNEIKKIEKEYNKEKNKEEIKNKSLKLKEKSNKILEENYEFSTLSSYDENKTKLRTGNYIETVLDLDEGLSEYKVGKIILKANEAKDAAQDEFPNDDMKRDAFRHFTWNYLSTESYGKYDTRTATINHEWGNLLINPITNYYDNQYNNYLADGYSSSTASNKAFVDATGYIVNLKYNLVQIFKSDFSLFKGFMQDSHIMDLNNNCYGRAYPSKSTDYRSAFYTAKNNGELILSEISVSDWDYKYVWQNEWYTY